MYTEYEGKMERLARILRVIKKIALVAAVGGNHKMEFTFISVLQLPERRSLFFRKSRLK